MDWKRDLLKNSKLLLKGQAELKMGQKRIEAILGKVAGQRAKTADGPVPPDKFRLKGKEYKNIPPGPWKLLQCLWDRDAVTFDEARDRVYEVNSGAPHSNLFDFAKRLNRLFAAQGFPGSVCRDSRTKLLWLDVEQDHEGAPKGRK
jgi:hypothetical protein